MRQLAVIRQTRACINRFKVYAISGKARWVCVIARYIGCFAHIGKCIFFSLFIRGNWWTNILLTGYRAKAVPFNSCVIIIMMQ